ncbi:hypothetical protein [Leptospira noguchii]|nr:hypothetical protein [Leptospira noguchii]
MTPHGSFEVTQRLASTVARQVALTKAKRFLRKRWKLSKTLS